MGLKFKRQNDLRSEFSKYAELDLTDSKKDKFFKKTDQQDKNKKVKDLITEQHNYHK